MSRMGDLVVTVPQDIWPEWIAEGDPAGTEPATGVEWGFYVSHAPPDVRIGDRLYIVAWGRLRGYAPITRLAQTERGWAICREGGAIAVTLPHLPIAGFRGYRKRWWERSQERPFPDWKTAGVDRRARERIEHMALVEER
jgi:hypothetical protein